MQRLILAEHINSGHINAAGVSIEYDRRDVEPWLIVLWLLAQLLYTADHPARDQSPRGVGLAARNQQRIVGDKDASDQQQPCGMVYRAHRIFLRQGWRA